MSRTVETHSSLVELDKAFHYAVTLAWEDLTKPVEPRAIRVEYLCEPGSPLDQLSVWSVRAGGYQDLVCDFRTSASLAQQGGACFGNRHSSDKLAASLGFIMKNQGQFTRPADAGRHGLVLIHTPDADDRKEAANWMSVARALQGAPDLGQAPVPPADRRQEDQRQEDRRQEDHRQDAEASSRMDDEGYSAERADTRPDATRYSGYEWSPVS